MEKHELLSDEEFVEQFVQRKVDNETFSHEAQIRLTWLFLNKFGRTIATEKIIQTIEEINASKNIEILFDKNLASQTIRVLDIYRKASNSESFNSFKTKYSDIQKDTIKLFSINQNENKKNRKDNKR